MTKTSPKGIFKLVFLWRHIAFPLYSQHHFFFLSFCLFLSLFDLNRQEDRNEYSLSFPCYASFKNVNFNFFKFSKIILLTGFSIGKGLLLLPQSPRSEEESFYLRCTFSVRVLRAETVFWFLKPSPPVPVGPPVTLPLGAPSGGPLAGRPPGSPCWAQAPEWPRTGAPGQGCCSRFS